MTTKTLSFKSLPQLAIAESDTTPNPGIAGVTVWSTSLSKPVYWTGTLWTAGSGGGGSTVTGRGTCTIDFGSGAGSNEATVTVTGQTGILSTSVVNLSVKADSTSSDHTTNDHSYLPVFCSFSVGTITNASGFPVYARSPHKLTGTWTVNYNWIQ